MSLNLIKQHRPDIYKTVSFDGSLFDYLETLNTSHIEHVYFLERRIKFMEIVKSHVSGVLGNNMPIMNESHLLTPLNTTDHFGFIQHPEPLNTALVDIIRQGEGKI